MDGDVVPMPLSPSAWNLWVLRYWGTWIPVCLLLSANVLTHRKGREDRALILAALAWQFVLYDSARWMPESLFGGTVMSHSGPAVAVSYTLESLREYWLLPAALTVPMAPFLVRSGFRKAIREHRWAMLATVLAFVNFTVMLAGVSWALRTVKWP